MYGQVIDVHLVQHFIPEEVALAITDMEGVNLALNDQHNNAGASTSKGKFWILLVELVIEFEESFVHEYLNHLVEIACLIEQIGPLLYLQE